MTSTKRQQQRYAAAAALVHQQKLETLVGLVGDADQSLPASEVRRIVASVTARPQVRTMVLRSFEEVPDLLTSGATNLPPVTQRLISELVDAGSIGVVRPCCDLCGRPRLLTYRLPGGKRACQQCGRARNLASCSRCGHSRPVEVRMEGRPVCASCNRQDPTKHEPCVSCGRVRHVHARLPDGPRCASCAPRRTEICVECGRLDRPLHGMLNGPVCKRCVERLRRNPDTCPGCEQIKVLAYLDDHERRACATCVGRSRSPFACARCHREDNQHGRLCAACSVQDRARDLLGGLDGQLHPALAPVFTALCNADRPKSTLYWLQRSHGAALLGQMARGEIPVSHDGLDQLPRTKVIDHLRDLLIAVGVLPQQVVHLERLGPWLREFLDRLPDDHARIIGLYATWDVLRRARDKAERGELTSNAAEHARAEVIGTAEFLDFIAQRGRDAATARQSDLDDYLTERPSRRRDIDGFLNWARPRRIISDIRGAPWRHATPEVTLTDDDRWSAVARLLHDHTIKLDVRVAGLFVLLYGQPLTRICRTIPDQVGQNGESVTIRFGATPITLPAPLDGLVLELLDRRGHSSYASRPDRWLFPGGSPGRHRNASSFRRRLAEVGIMLQPARNAALMQLAAEIPAPVIADLLGLVPRHRSPLGHNRSQRLGRIHRSTRPGQHATRRPLSELLPAR